MEGQLPKEHAPHVGLRCSELGRVKAVITAIRIRGRLDIIINKYPAFLFVQRILFIDLVNPWNSDLRMLCGFNLHAE